MNTPRIDAVAFTRYESLGASSRMRLLQYLPALAESHVSMQVSALLDDDYLLARYAGRANWFAVIRGYVRRLLRLLALWIPGHRPHVVWVEKELWPWAPAWFERMLLARCPFVLDLDDAIFHQYDQHRLASVRRTYGRKIDRLMRAAAVVTTGSPYLAERARAAGAGDTRVVPTAVDLGRYATTPSHRPDGELVLGWIGSPATVHYLDVVASALRHLARSTPTRLLVIGAEAPAIEGLTTESIAWSEASEAASIGRCHVGIMPLPDSPWERGKCGYKLIQYMACSLPVVASPVGVNCEIVRPNLNGELAADEAGWVRALSSMARDPQRRQRYGRCGRAQVELRYCTQVTAPLVAGALLDAARRAPGRSRPR